MIRVGVIRGGIGNGYEASLKTGADLLSVLREHHKDKYQPVDIFIDKDGQWHIGGRPIAADRLLRDVDVIWNGLHGEYGESGLVQQFFEQMRIPYTGSESVSSAIAMNKKMTKDKARALDIRVSDEYMISDYRKQHGTTTEVYFKEHAQNIFLRFSPPWVIKPVGSSSSIGVSIVKTRGELYDALIKTAEHSGDIMVEPYLNGKEAAVTVTDNFRGQKTYSFLPVSLSSIPFSEKEKIELEKSAKSIHENLGLRHYSRSDFIVTPKGIYFLEVNTLPDMTQESLISKALEPVGSSLPEFVDHVIRLALEKK